MYLHVVGETTVDDSKSFAAAVSKLEVGETVELICATGPWAERKPILVRVSAHLDRIDSVEWIQCLRMLCGKEIQPD